ncbi:MAG TPA: GAF domain-containing protein, partial [Aggregatilineales bacterium]|nr:GAF domain-containing protein [Aggregatilineales bacterium]
METNTVEFLERLLDISRIMAENQEPDPLLEYAMQVAMELVNAEQGHLILMATDRSLEFRVTHGALEEISHSILNRVLENREPLRITDALSSEEFEGAPSIQDFRLRSIMCVPLISREILLGAVYVENRSNANVFQQPHLDVLVFFAKQAAVLIENAMLTASLQQAREQLVITREEERRRIRRDLHSELGPSLAALRLE